jgi:L-lactate dehydrogenase (cytochrome)
MENSGGARDLGAQARTRMFYDYVDSGSWTESTYRANERELAAIAFGSVWP